MLDGLGFLLGQIAVLLVLALVIGLLVGRYVFPRRKVVRASTARMAGVVPGPGPGTVSSRPDVGRSGAGPDLGAAGPRTDVGVNADAGASAGAGPEAATDPAETISTEDAAARLVEMEMRLVDTRRRLAETSAELLRMQAKTQAVADEKEAELGRLESGAVAALESTLAQHRERVAGLEIRLQAAEETVQLQVRQLDVERRRSVQLRAALTERDEHLATPMADLPGRDRREDAVRPAGGPSSS
jgi:hypothetical protein